VFSGATKTRARQQKHTPGSLSIGPQPHIHRLKRFFCDNIDKQNVELAGKIQFVPGHFSHHLKSLISDRLSSAKGTEAPVGFFQNLDAQKLSEFNFNQPKIL